MDMFTYLPPALFDVVASPMMWLWIVTGVMLGYIFGALPGLTATLGVALLTPLTFPLPTDQALTMMIALYCGSMTGGAIPSILLNIPGTPSAVVTAIDGYPMAKKGQATQAYGWALVGSFVGGIISWVALATIAPGLARLALMLGPAEYAAVALLGMTLIASISSDQLTKGIIGALFGVGLSVVGFDHITGEGRWIFGQLALAKGIDMMPALIGILVIPELINSIPQNIKFEYFPVTIRNIIPPMKEMLRLKGNFFWSSVIGVLVGIVPALGGSVASLIAYDQAKRHDENGDKYGTGEPGGVLAAETANNALTGGALIPVFTLGIPGDSVTAMLLGGLMIHGLQPGPRLFETNGEMVWIVIAAMLISNIVMLGVGLFCIRWFIKALDFPNALKVPCLLVLTVVGTYALSNQWFDVLVMLVLGVIGFVMMVAQFPVYPIVIGIILGPLLEAELRRALVISGGDWAVFVQRPFCAVILTLIVLTLVGPSLVSKWKKSRGAGKPASSSC